ncbi:Piso0_001912 [Millerozyma farinosa CBS 7064]|uniref:Piso0_001912 protein n=1 Tax=Pichia sorbitophila (strain ATCC MYA-4447 / BCRC 22081 / CBS 7064 / NBRC 10061 / NRRL Y-12695) TaxID=559304 RepID=G8YB68_PICSO|nr:Piso0_001912 [Millerozyma farinosa CBS 7064]
MTDLTNEFSNMSLALFLAFKALLSNETPVACILVEDDKVIAVGYNGTNKTLNGTRHAEFEAIDQALRYFAENKRHAVGEHIVKEFEKVTLYVTVEPCIMCASALRQIGIKRVVFGCANERFGGNGTILKVHQEGPGQPYNSFGGVLRTESIQLLRNFYIQENTQAPIPKTKKNKDIEGKVFPPAIHFENYVSHDEFLSFYGEERAPFFAEENREITPLPNQGYCIVDIIDEEKLLSIPQLQELYSKEPTSSLSDDLTTFAKTFYPIGKDGTVNYDKEILTVQDFSKRHNQKTTSKLDVNEPDHKKCKLTSAGPAVQC